MNKRILKISVVLIVFIGVSIYLNESSSYNQILNNNNNNNNKDLISKKDRSIDEQVYQQRRQNEKSYSESGITGSFTSGEGYAPKMKREDFASIIEGLKIYINKHPDIYPKYDEYSREYRVGINIDPRFESLLWGKPKDQRKSFLAGYDDKDIIIMEARRKDGNYDNILMLKNKSGPWEVKFVGSYYELKKILE